MAEDTPLLEALKLSNKLSKLLKELDMKPEMFKANQIWRAIYEKTEATPTAQP